MEEIQRRVPEIFEAVTEDIRDKDPIEIKSDLEILNWLSVGNSIQIFKSFLEMADLFGVLLLTFPDRFSVLDLPQVQYFINTMVFQFTSQEIKETSELGTQYIQKTNFFKAARDKITAKHEDIESVVEEINAIYKRFRSILSIAFMHISKKFESKNKKDFSTFLNDLFYNDVLMNAHFTYKNSMVIKDIIGQYMKRPQYGYGVQKIPANLYFGEVDESGKRSGFGRVSFENGDKFEGEWVNDFMHGFGLYIWKDNGWYKGEILNGEIRGRGIRKFLDGSIYEGEFVKGKRHGNGKMTFKNGDIYEGTWQADAMSGDGDYIWAKTNDSYKGKFRYDMRSNGVLTLSTGETFKISN